ncbi:MAG: hypothetical protein JXC36_05980 [Candidatus Atribacteria bacterium]|nr:hypothetical protein [Candidatus Atribacteria bacterium]
MATEVDSNGFAKMDSQVFIYYGAADTCVGLAIAAVNELIQMTAD